MRVKWLGNSCVELLSEERVVVDPHPTVELYGKADKILITHEHDDHFDRSVFDRISVDAEVYAPKYTLDKFDIQGTAVKPGDEFENFNDARGLIELLEEKGLVCKLLSPGDDLVL